MKKDVSWWKRFNLPENEMFLNLCAFLKYTHTHNHIHTVTQEVDIDIVRNFNISLLVTAHNEQTVKFS